MAENKTSILLSDVSIEGDLIEKDKIIIDAKINGDIKAEEIETHQKSNINVYIISSRLNIISINKSRDSKKCLDYLNIKKEN